MGLFGRGKSGGAMNVIRCDEQEYLVWKWRPLGQEANTTSRENSIRLNSSLRVKDGEVAVFVYKQKDGPMQDYIVGPFDETLKTANLPILASILGLAWGGESPVQAEVYFINLASVIQVNFTIPYFDIQDPRFPDLSIPVASSGKLTFRIEDYKAFIKVNRLINFTLDDFKRQIKEVVTRRVKSSINNILLNNNIPLAQIERYIDPINDQIQDRLKTDLDDFGVVLRRLDLTRIEPDKDSANWLKLNSLTADFAVNATQLNQQTALNTARTQSEVNLKNMREMQEINAENLAESLRIQREEMKYAQHLGSQSANIGAFTVGQQAQVLNTAASNLGQMSSMGGGNGGGFNPAAMMTGMAVGGAVGRQMAGMMTDMNSGMNNAMNQGVNPGLQQAMGGGVPPLPGQGATTYHVALNGQQAGPFDMAALQAYAAQGAINAQTLVWSQGMPGWTAAGQVAELMPLFTPTAPPPMPGAPGGAGVPPIPTTPPTL